MVVAFVRCHWEVLMDDQQLKQNIIDVLRDDTRVDDREITVRVENGVVYLEGSVDSAYERKAAREDVETVPGVKQVVDYLGLRNWIPRTEEELAEAVRQDLLRDAYVDPKTIEVRAHQSEVALEGSVRTHMEKTAAESVAWWTPGVTNVIDHLSVTEEDMEE
jgi:osmotically-inducible protein OsmY